MINASLSQQVLARHMILAGYVNKVVIIETGLTYKQILRITRELRSEGYRLERKSRSCRGGATLIHSQASKMQASMLMQFYVNIGGEEVLNSINIQALGAAFQLYRMAHKEVPGLAGPRWEPFDITDAWCLAQELRSGEAMIEECKRCSCTYFTSVNQRTSVDCPFCHDPARHAANKASKKQNKDVAEPVV